MNYYVKNYSTSLVLAKIEFDSQSFALQDASMSQS